jgi:hypothetical protein
MEVSKDGGYVDVRGAAADDDDGDDDVTGERAGSTCIMK